jgi:hypothetical protein
MNVNELRTAWEIKIDGKDIEARCKRIPLCYYCSLPENGGEKVKLRGWSINPQNFELIPNSGDKNAYALDTVVRCPVCGSCEIFGIALSKEEYDKMMGIIHGQLAGKN